MIRTWFENVSPAHDRPLTKLCVPAVVVGAVLFRSALFLVWDQVLFDSDEAVWGLMGKHISEGRAFPVFMYGQRYMLGVEAWLAAPVFLVAGVSVAALRVPVLLMNIAIALLLWRFLERDAGLRPWQALVPTLFFALVAPGTAGAYVQASGGTVEPLLYVLLLWAARSRPAVAGVVLAIGFLHREFTLYGLFALLAIQAAGGSLFARDGLRRFLVMFRSAAGVWLLIEHLRDTAPGMGPGTAGASVLFGHASVVDLATRSCLNLDVLSAGAWRILTEHWPALFGVRHQPVLAFGIDSRAWQGMPGGWILLAASMASAAAAVAARLLRDRHWRREYDFCAYLVMTGIFSTAGYAVGRCGGIDVLRYDVLSVLGAAGLAAWFLSANPARWLQRGWLILTIAYLAIPTAASARVLAEYLDSPPPASKSLIARELESRGIRYASADYWLSYALVFLTEERVIVASEDFERIEEYEKAVAAHRAEAPRISRRPCGGGRLIRGGVYLCGPE